MQVSLLFSRFQTLFFHYFMHYLPNTGGLNQNSEHVWDQVKPSLNLPKIVTLRGHLLPALGLTVWSLFSCFLTIFGVFYLVAIGNFSMFDIYSSSGVKTAPANPASGGRGAANCFP